MKERKDLFFSGLSMNESAKIYKDLVLKRDVGNLLKDCRSIYDPSIVLENSLKELSKAKGKMTSIDQKSATFKAMTLSEFENGTLMTYVVPEQYRTFALKLSRELQEEFICVSSGEKAIAELAAVNYIRTLEIQNRINSYLALGSITDMGVRYLEVLSKELDRAQRHYISSFQTLKTLRQPVFQLNLKADTAVVGQNQMVQSNINKHG